MIVIKGNQLPDATTLASLEILLSSSRIIQMPKLLGPKVRVIATKAVAIKAMVIGIVGIMGRLKVRPILWMPMSHRGILLLVDPLR